MANAWFLVSQKVDEAGGISPDFGDVEGIQEFISVNPPDNPSRRRLMRIYGTQEKLDELASSPKATRIPDQAGTGLQQAFQDATGLDWTEQEINARNWVKDPEAEE